MPKGNIFEEIQAARTQRPTEGIALAGFGIRRAAANIRAARRAASSGLAEVIPLFPDHLGRPAAQRPLTFRRVIADHWKEVTLGVGYGLLSRIHDLRSGNPHSSLHDVNVVGAVADTTMIEFPPTDSTAQGMPVSFGNELTE